MNIHTEMWTIANILDKLIIYTVIKHHLGLDLYFENWADDGKSVTDNNQDIPAAHKLQLVRPWNLFTSVIPAVECVLLCGGGRGGGM